MDNEVVPDLSKMPKWAKGKQNFIWPIKITTSGSPQFIHLVSKQSKFHLIPSEKLVYQVEVPPKEGMQSTQGIRMDLNKRSGPQQKTITA